MDFLAGKGWMERGGEDRNMRLGRGHGRLGKKARRLNPGQGRGKRMDGSRGSGYKVGARPGSWETWEKSKTPKPRSRAG